MNKLFLAIPAAFLVSSINVAVAQVGSATGTNGAQDNGHPTGAAAATSATDFKDPPHRPTTGDTSGMNMEHDKSTMSAMHKGKMGMKAMDTNHDGMISKEEFMTYHEAMYDHMTKNKDGMVDVNAMGMMKGKKDK